MKYTKTIVSSLVASLLFAATAGAQVLIKSQVISSTPEEATVKFTFSGSLDSGNTVSKAVTNADTLYISLEEEPSVSGITYSQGTNDARFKIRSTMESNSVVATPIDGSSEIALFAIEVMGPQKMNPRAEEDVPARIAFIFDEILANDPDFSGEATVVLKADGELAADALAKRSVAFAINKNVGKFRSPYVGETTK